MATSAELTDTAQAAQITQITLERNCFGCTTGSMLLLRRDGTALLTMTGNARSGTTDRTQRGNVRLADFEALARRAVDSGYLAFDASYQDPALQDGPWAATTVRRDGPDGSQEKRVFRRDEAGPTALREFEAAIDGVMARIRFLPAAP
jgi:hypothetical protein